MFTVSGEGVPGETWKRTCVVLNSADEKEAEVFLPAEQCSVELHGGGASSSPQIISGKIQVSPKSGLVVEPALRVARPVGRSLACSIYNRDHASLGSRSGCLRLPAYKSATGKSPLNQRRDFPVAKVPSRRRGRRRSLKRALLRICGGETTASVLRLKSVCRCRRTEITGPGVTVYT